MGTTEDPRFMESYLENALSVIDHAKRIPKALFKAAKGVMLISAREGGFLVSATSGSGVLISHNKDGSWGNTPMAIHVNGYGGGAVFGYANQDIVVIMNHFSMNRLLEGRGETRLGLEVGFACGECCFKGTLKFVESNATSSLSQTHHLSIITQATLVLPKALTLLFRTRVALVRPLSLPSPRESW